MTSPRTVNDRFDDLAAFPAMRQVRKAVGADSWDYLVELFDGFTDDNTRAAGIRAAAQVANGERLFRSHDDVLGRTLLAAREIELASFGLTDGPDGLTDVTRQRIFRTHMIRAERSLTDACAMEPANVPAWELRLATAMNLGLTDDEVARRYHHVVAQNPRHYPAQLLRLQSLCPKVGGSWELALDFARRTSALASEPCMLSPALIPRVHLEQWAIDDDVHPLRDKDVQREVDQAARESVLHKDFPKVYGWVQAHSTFALYYCLAGRTGLAARHFRATGALRSRYPWTLFRDPAVTYARYRASALGGG